MRIIAFIADSEIIKKIVKSAVGGWGVKRKPTPRTNGPPSEALIIYDESSSPSADDYIVDADYSMETCL